MSLNNDKELCQLDYFRNAFYWKALVLYREGIKTGVCINDGDSTGHQHQKSHQLKESGHQRNCHHLRRSFFKCLTTRLVS